MGRILRIGLVASVLVLLLAGWHSYKAATSDPSPFRQIFIHDTPVCVFQMEGEVLARIGPCPDTAGPGSESMREAPPFPGRHRMELPPGHPPVEEKTFDNKRSPIAI